MPQPAQVEVFFPEQPFGGVLVEMPPELQLLAINSGSPVKSVFGRTGHVTAQCADYDQCYASVAAGLPAGGAPGEVLTKLGEQNFNVGWSSAGAGNVISSGTPIAGQMAYWLDSTHILGLTTLLEASFPALTGDVTTVAGSFATTISNDAVTYAKIQNVAAASRLLGRGSAAGAGNVEEIILGTNLSMSGTTLNATGGGVTDGDKGDITVSGGGATWLIDAGAVTLAKMADMATDSILGRATAGTGSPEVLSALPFAFTGDVTRPADSNAQTIPNDTVTYAKMQNVSAASRLLGRGDSGSGDPQEISLGTNLAMSGTTLNAGGAFGGSMTGVGNTNYTILNTDRIVFTNAAFSAARTWTLPTASTVSAGTAIAVIDLQGTLTTTNTLTVQRSASDLIFPPNAGTYQMSNPYQGTTFVSDGISKWYAINIQPGVNGLGGNGNFAQTSWTAGVWAASLYNMPTSIGATGKLLQSNGSNVIFSAPAWPASAGAAGNVPRSNGTDYVATTLSASDLTDIATDSILGRATAGTGDPEVLTALPFAFTGDVTRPADSNAQTIANDAVTYAKMQNVSAASRLLGRGSAAGAGDPEEITLGTNLSFSGTTLNATGGASFANPTASVGLTAVNGSLTTAMRSDAAPPLDQAIAPTWSANHIFQTSDAGTGNVTTPITLRHVTSGTAAANFGSGILFSNESGGGSNVQAATLNVAWSNAGAGAETSYMDFGLTSAGSFSSRMRLHGSSGLSVGHTTDPSAGIISANTGFKIGANEFPAASNGLIQRTSANTYSSGNLSGDVTTSGSLATTIGNDIVTYAKMQNVSAASKLLGRGDSGSGDPQEITLGSGLSMSGTTLSVSAGGGNVSNVGTPTDGQIAQWDSSNTIRGVTPTSPIVSDGSANTISLDVGVNFNFTQNQDIIREDANNSGVTQPLGLTHNTSGSPANGLGVGIAFSGETSTTISSPMGQLDLAYSDITHATRSAYMNFRLVNSGTIGDKMRLFPSGGLSVNDTTDPGAGQINANSGFKVGGAALNFSHLAGDFALTQTPSAAASKLIGRGAGSGAGDWQEITLGTNLSMSGTTLNATGGGGGGSPGGATGDLQLNNAGSFDVFSQGSFIDDNMAGGSSGAIKLGKTGQTADTFIGGFWLENSTAAASGDQQHSPGLQLTGRGWKTDATAASQVVDWRIYNKPVQGAANPTTRLEFESQVNAGGFTERAALLSNNQLLLTGNASSTSAPNYSWVGRETNGMTPNDWAGGGVSLIAGGAHAVAVTGFSGGRLGMAADGYLVFSNTSGDPTQSSDLGFARNANGIAEVNNGTAGQWARLKLGMRDAGTSDLVNGLTISRLTTGTAATNFGIAALFQLETDNGTENKDAGQIAVRWSDATNASFDARMDFNLAANAGSPSTVMTLSSTGTLDVDEGFTIGAAAASGKLLKGDGTRFIASTETWAAPGTAGNHLRSDGTNWVAVADVPQNAQNAAYTFVADDAGKHIFHDEATARTYTIPANSSVAFPVGTTITIVNNNAGGTITLAITTDTLRRGDGTAGTGSRTITADSIATIIKTKTTEWMITGKFS